MTRRAVAGTSFVCRSCGCRWKGSLTPTSTLSLYDAKQRPCAECDNASKPPLRLERESEGAVRERPILFSSPMVRAILAGRKTQTRRVISGKWWRCLDPDDPDDRATATAQGSPYGLAGDRLWVRETWALAIAPLPGAKFAYRASEDANAATVELVGRWRPSIFMPRSASRIDLEILSVRVERLQDISEADAIAEGARSVTFEGGRQSWNIGDDVIRGSSPAAAFRIGWDALNGKRAPWESNPWVWCIAFRRIRP